MDGKFIDCLSLSFDQMMFLPAADIDDDDVYRTIAGALESAVEVVQVRSTKERCLRLYRAISADRSSAASRSAFMNRSALRSGMPRTTNYRRNSNAQSPRSRNKNANIGWRLTFL